MDYRDFEKELRRWASVANLAEYGRVDESGKTYPLYCLTTPGRRELVVTAGFHGEEPAGPLTLLECFGELAEQARAHDVALRVFPCINPSGFERGERYNASGEQPNNDFLRYEVTPGVSAEEVAPGQPIHAWHLYDAGPKETRAVRSELNRHPPPAAALDLHQDAWVRSACFYAYYFGDPTPYRALMQQTLAHAKVAIHLPVHGDVSTDAYGLIVHHDGSNSDWFYRRGVKHVAVLETSTRLPWPQCRAVNLVWLKRFVELAAQG